MNILSKIALFMRLQGPIDNISKEVKKVKKGYLTTEFWIVIVSNLIAVAGALNGVLDAETAAKVLGVLNAVYAVLRTLAKAPASQAVDASTTTTIVTK